MELYMGAAQEIITPPIGCKMAGYNDKIFSTEIGDDLTVSAFYFEQEGRKLMMISACVCSIRISLSRFIREQIAQAHDIPVDHITISCIHTHSGPVTFGGYKPGWEGLDEDYCRNTFVPQILKAAARAVAQAQPVEMGVGIGESRIGVNRMEVRLDNKIYLGQCPWRPFNPTMTVLSFRDKAGVTVGNMIHYGCHNTGAGMNTEISRDWSGVMVDALAEKSGAVTAFFNGPEGDVGPRLSNGKTTGDLKLAYELGEVAAKDALAIYDTIDHYYVPKLAVQAKEVRVPFLPRMTKQEATALYEEHKDQANGGSVRRVQWAQAVLDAIERGEEEKEADVFVQQVAALGDQVFAAFPFELFSEIGMRIDGAFEHLHVMSLALTDGGKGYFCTEEALVLPSYESMMHRFSGGKNQQYVPNGDYYLILETIENIKGLEK